MASPIAKTFARVFAAGTPVMMALLLAGCDPGKEKENERPEPSPQPSPSAPIAPTKTEAVAEEVDLIGDKPDAKGVKPSEKATVLLDPIEPTGPVNRVARQAYKIIADIKTNIEKVNVDLDGGGKQVTRLIHNSDEVCKNITDLAAIWPDNNPFRDQCIAAKRQALTLNEELSRVPRTWQHVRWAFTSTLKSLSQLRIRAAELADAEPKPQVLVGKDGKTVIVEAEPAPIDPALAKRNETVAKAKRMRDQLKQMEDDKKKKQMPTDLDSK